MFKCRALPADVNICMPYTEFVMYNENALKVSGFTQKN